MKICPIGAELFHANRRTDGRTDRQTWRSSQSLIASFRMHLKNV